MNNVVDDKTKREIAAVNIDILAKKARATNTSSSARNLVDKYAVLSTSRVCDLHTRFMYSTSIVGYMYEQMGKSTVLSADEKKIVNKFMDSIFEMNPESYLERYAENIHEFSSRNFMCPVTSPAWDDTEMECSPEFAMAPMPTPALSTREEISLIIDKAKGRMAINGEKDKKTAVDEMHDRSLFIPAEFFFGYSTYMEKNYSALRTLFKEMFKLPSPTEEAMCIYDITSTKEKAELFAKSMSEKSIHDIKIVPLNRWHVHDNNFTLFEVDSVVYNDNLSGTFVNDLLDTYSKNEKIMRQLAFERYNANKDAKDTDAIECEDEDGSYSIPAIRSLCPSAKAGGEASSRVRGLISSSLPGLPQSEM